MFKVFQMTRDPRAAVLADGDSVLITIVSGGQRLVINTTGTLGGQLRADLASLVAPVVASRPPPPRYKWRQLMSRLDGNRLTDSDRDALRSLMYELGVMEIKSNEC